MLQPTLWDEGSKTWSAEERALPPPSPSWIEGVHRGYPALRERAHELTERGVSFFDASRAFARVDATLYFDACHFGKQGNEILAEILANQLLSAVVQAPKAAR